MAGTAAAADPPPGWSGYIRIAGTFNYPGAYSGTTQTLWTFDGSTSEIRKVTDPSSPNYTLDYEWIQPASWQASYHQVTAASGCTYGDPPQSGTVVRHMDGSGSGSGQFDMRFDSFAGAWYDAEAGVTTGGGGDFPIAVSFDTPCPGYEGYTDVFAACGGSTNFSVGGGFYQAQDMPGDQGIATTEIHGSRDAEGNSGGCRSDVQTIHVEWRMVRGQQDDDHDGVPDPSDNCRPGSVSGTRQEGDPPITVDAAFNPGQQDSDHDGRGDVCDTDQTATLTVFTRDGDGVGRVFGRGIACADDCSETYSDGGNVI